jgi:hypothetical protein
MSAVTAGRTSCLSCGEIKRAKIHIISVIAEQPTVLRFMNW